MDTFYFCSHSLNYTILLYIYWHKIFTKHILRRLRILEYHAFSLITYLYIYQYDLLTILYKQTRSIIISSRGSRKTFSQIIVVSGVGTRDRLLHTRAFIYNM